MAWSFGSLRLRVKNFNKEHKKALRVRKVNNETQIINHLETVLVRGSVQSIGNSLNNLFEKVLKNENVVAPTT